MCYRELHKPCTQLLFFSKIVSQEKYPTLWKKFHVWYIHDLCALMRAEDESTQIIPTPSQHPALVDTLPSPFLLEQLTPWYWNTVFSCHLLSGNNNSDCRQWINEWMSIKQKIIISSGKKEASMTPNRNLASILITICVIIIVNFSII